MKRISWLICALLIVAAEPVPTNASWAHLGRHRRIASIRREDRLGYGLREPEVCGFGLRDSHGRLKRCAAARAAFQRLNPCPSTGDTKGPCPGYVVDHIIPLKRNGADDPSNMQWQTVEDAKLKDRVE